MSRNLRIAIGLGFVAVVGLIIVLALIVANLGPIMTWIGFDDAGNLDGPSRRAGSAAQSRSACTKRDSMRGRCRVFGALADYLLRWIRLRYRHWFRVHDLARAAPSGVSCSIAWVRIASVPWVFMQPAADGVKLVFKEDLLPARRRQVGLPPGADDQGDSYPHDCGRHPDGTGPGLALVSRHRLATSGSRGRRA